MAKMKTTTVCTVKDLLDGNVVSYTLTVAAFDHTELGHQEPVKGLEVQAHHLTSLGMRCIVLWPVWPPRTIKCNNNNLY
jgi:hypothetical protein